MKILMTGCCTGAGKTVRQSLIDEGHQVFGVGLAGPDLNIDFTKNDIDYCVRHLFSDYGSFDALLYCAGLTRINFLEKYSIRDFQDVMSVNLLAPFLFSREFVRCHKKGRMVFVGSMAMRTALRASPAYNASKAGLECMVRGLARELAGKFVLATVAPATIEHTQMHEQVIRDLQRTRNMSEEEARKYVNPYPIGRLVRHEELFKVIKYALVDMPEFCTGACLEMPGGLGI